MTKDEEKKLPEDLTLRDVQQIAKMLHIQGELTEISYGNLPEPILQAMAHAIRYGRLQGRSPLEAQIAMLVDTLREAIKDVYPGAAMDAINELLSDDALCKDADAFVARIKAEALEELTRRMSANDEAAMWNIDDMLRDLRKEK